MMDHLTAYVRALRGPIIVTGAAGFVGANLFHKLLAVRNDVFAIQKTEHNWRLIDTPLENIVTVDLTDASAIKNLIQEISPQTIFDCAAYGAYSFEGSAELIYATNFSAVVGLIEALRNRSIAAFVHAGTSSEYGGNSAAPSEDSVCVPNSNYAVSKLAISEYLRYVGKFNNFPCVNLRLYSVYGPLEDTSRLIPNLLRKASQGSLPPFVDPEISRDFVHVDDVCAAFILAAAKMNPSFFGETLNIGSGIKTTIRDLAFLTKQIFSISEEPSFGSMPGRDWDLPDWYSDPTKARSMLGWEAKIDLGQGLLSTADWVKNLSEAEFQVTANKAMRKKRRSVSAIIACYKDREAIPVMYRRLTDTFRTMGIDYELIFVNDCSPDDTAEVLRAMSASDPKVIGISHSRSFGSQMAFRSGMELSTKESVVLLDGDLQDPPELIPQFYAQWEEGYDVVYGRRVKREMPFVRGLLYKLFYRIFAAFSYVKIPLDAGDFSLMDRRVVGWILNCGERDLFVRGLRAYVGFRQTGVDYVRPERAFGHSTNNIFSNLEWAKMGIFSFSNTPLTMLTFAGVTCLILSFLVGFIEIALKIFMPSIAPKGVTTVLLSILIFGSLNLFAVGLIGEYIAKIILEVKGRPRLIRAALIRNGNLTELLPDGKAQK